MPRSPDDATARYRRVFLDRDRAAELSELLGRVWPPRSVVELDGWRLRTGIGLPDHAVSAWPRAAGTRVPLAVRIDGTVRHYREAGLPARVLVSRAAKPREVDTALARRGWVKQDGAEIRTGPLDAVRALRASPEVAVSVPGRDAWLASWAQLTGRGPAQVAGAAASLARVTAPSLLLDAHRDGWLAGVARAVIDGGWVGLSDVVVAGGDADVAATLARAAADWAGDHAVTRAWWLVAVDDAASGEAARRARLRPDLHLHLRVAPAEVRAPQPGPSERDRRRQRPANRLG